MMQSLRRLVLALALAAHALAATPPATAPASKPAPGRPLTKLTTTVGGGSKETVSALLDVNDAPDFKEWGLKAANYALKWYPEITRQLASDGFVPPREFTLLLKPGKGVASTTGTVITINTDYVKDHKDDLGMVAHELVHVIQHYNSPSNPGWLVEGVADYLRYYVVEPGTGGAKFNAKEGDYKGGYQRAAGLLNWIERQKGPGVVARLNAAMRAGRFNPETFKEVTGATPDDAWRGYKATFDAKP